MVAICFCGGASTAANGECFLPNMHSRPTRKLSRWTLGNDADEPGWRDTVLVEANDSVKLRTMFDNPGRWMAHCHILEHAELGMMTEIIVSE